MDQTPWLDELALAVADGRPIDWHAQDARLAADIDPDLIAPFRLVERIARAHRETTFDIELESMTVGPATGVEGLADEPGAAAVTWGPLTIAERIGGGSYGDVYRAHDRRLDRTVALKLLRRRDSAQARRASAVIEEGRLMARVRHPNVVTVYGAERIDGRVGLWMEYLEGQTLAEELRIGGPFSEEAVIEVARALCAALAAVHAAGLLHHDLKAQNVIRTTDGRIVLTDFGAGRLVMTESGAGESRQLRGTPAYLAPEILNGQPASLQSEVYSLGVLLYYLATGMFPDRTAPPEGIRRRLSEESALSPWLSSLVSRCLSPNPADRFKAMPDVAEAVNPMTDQTTRTQRFVRALKTRAWLWLLPALIGFGGAAIWSARTPYLYRSEALISMVPPKLPASMVPAVVNTQGLEDRIPAIRNEILSRTRLERIIQDLDLYATDRKTGIMEDIVERMRSEIVVQHVDGSAIRVGFVGRDPRTVQRVADRLAALFMDESTRGRKLQIEGTDQFLETSLQEMSHRLKEAEKSLAQAQATGGPRGSVAAETLELEVVKERYKTLLVQQLDTNLAANMERREIGEQFSQIDPARMPETPIGPPRWLVKLVATLGGLAVGLLLVGLSSARAERPSSAAAEPA